MRLARLLIIAFSLVVSCGQPLFSQIRHSFFNNYTIRDGLTDNIIHCIHQDDEGWIWMGTSFGVVRFDGYNFQKFDLKTPESDILGQSLIRTIIQDQQGNIWIGTENRGIFVYKRKNYELHRLIRTDRYDGLCSNSVWSIVEDNNGKFWIGTERGLNQYDPITNVFKPYYLDPENPERASNNFIRTLSIDHNGNLWIGTSNGVTLFDLSGNEFHNYLSGDHFTERENEVWEIYEDAKYRIWVGTYLGGMMLFNRQENKFEKYSLEKDNDRAKTVRAIVQDKSGNLWIGTRGGLYQIDEKNKQKSHFVHDDLNDNSLGHNSVIKLMIDAKGDLWAGTRAGVSHLNFDKQAFGNISAGNIYGKELNNSEVYALWEGIDHDIWIGTESGGINIYDYSTNSIRYLTDKDGLSNNCVKAFCYFNNKLYIGTYLGGLNILDMQTGRIEHIFNDPNDVNSLSDDAVWSILRDSQDRIWVGTDDGLDIFDTSTKKFNRLGDRYGMSNVTMVYEDRKGRIWAYSENLKLSMIDNDGKVRDFPYKARTICDDKNNNIWIGTLGNGLTRFNPETNKSATYTIDDGLCNNIIYGIINIEDRYLWISTINGISRFDIHKQEFKNYYRNDGLLNSQYNYGAYLKKQDGTLVFGGAKGIDFIFLDRLDENRYIPPVVFTDFKVFNKSIPIKPNVKEKNTLPNLICETDHIILDYDQSMLTFEFAALNYANSEKNEYAYMMEGFDKDWNYIGNQRRATYTNLDPGEYTLRVIGSNNDKLYNRDGASISITILPPFWKTMWFKFLMILTLISLVFAGYRVVLNREKLKNQLLFERQSARKVQELDRLKHQFFMNISHEIRTPLSLILGPLNKLMHYDLSDNERQSHLEIIYRNTQNLKKLVNQLLDYRRLETGNVTLDLKKGDIIKFLRGIYTAFNELADERKIQLSFKSHINELFVFFDPDKVEKIVNNLLSNAIKYTADEGNVSLTISAVFFDDISDNETFLPEIDKKQAAFNQYVQIVVRDTGIGIPSSQVGKIFNRFLQVKNQKDYVAGGTGIGLSLTKDLVAVHKGHISVKSKEGKGSRFKILLPLIENIDEGDGRNIEAESLVLKKDIPDEAAEAQNLVTENGGRQPILLIVEDNPDIKLFIKHHFEPEYRIIMARNGQEGWERALEFIPDIILADIMMPVMDGREFCRKVKKDERTSHIPVVMLTALSSSDNQIEGIDAGADDYITKPFDISILKARIDNIISIRKALRERYSKEMILKPKEIILSSPDEKFLKKVIQVIEKNIDNVEMDVDEMASQIGVSRTQLYRKISALTDMSAKEFVRDIRLERAAQLITQDKLTISEIALKTGFNDISYFRKCFKEKFGMSASEYLKSHIKETDTGNNLNRVP